MPSPDHAVFYTSGRASNEAAFVWQLLARQLGLDQPAWQRYGAWVQGLLHGDMGESYAYGSPVGELVAERLAVTVPLAFLAMGLASAVALLAGMFAASRHNRAGDVGTMALVQLGIAVPNFWLAILLILLLILQQLLS